MKSFVSAVIVSLSLCIISVGAKAHEQNAVFSQSSQQRQNLANDINRLKQDLHLRYYQASLWNMWSQSMIELSRVPETTGSPDSDSQHLIQSQLNVLDDFERRAHYALARTQLFLGDLDAEQQKKVVAFWQNTMPRYQHLPHSSPFNVEDVVGVTGCDLHCIH